VATHHDFDINLEYVQLPEKPKGMKTAVLAIAPKHRKGDRYLFNMDHAWIIREDHLMIQCAREIFTTLYPYSDPDKWTSTKKMAHIAMAIEDYIDELVKSKPAPELEKITIGEGKVTVNGVNHHFELTEDKVQ